MPVSDTARKWWHIEVGLEDRNTTVLETLTTIDPGNVNTNADPNISARLLDCSGTIPIPPRAWDISESPGYFTPRPDIEQIGSAFKDVDSYEQVINIDNRRVFRYHLRAAYNNVDFDCTAIVPNVMDPADINIRIENVRSVVFRIAEMELIEELGCCEIEISDPPDLLDAPGSLVECSRLWYIVDEGDSSHLYSFDVDESLGSAIIDRGVINFPFGDGIYELNYYDLAWDNRNFLWGMESNGLTRLLIGDSSVSAYAMDYAPITNPFSSTAEPFPITLPASQAYGALAFNQNNNKLYMFCNRRFWELQSTSETEWEVTNVSYEFGESELLGDIAFGPDGQCYCFHNNKLSTIIFEPTESQIFGFLRYVGDGGEYSNFIGLDFIADVETPDQATLYGAKEAGQLYIINTENANKSLYSGASLGDIAIGLTSCQAGEDLRTLPFPFYPGQAPWVFMLDTSNSMSGEKIERIRTSLLDFVSSYVRLGDELSIISFNTTFSQFGPRVMQNSGDVEDIVAFINGMTVTGKSNFCAAFTELGNPVTYHNVSSVVVLSGGQFEDCGSNQTEVNENISTLWEAVRTNNPTATLYSVGILPSAEASLVHLGSIGGGGYVRWA